MAVILVVDWSASAGNIVTTMVPAPNAPGESDYDVTYKDNAGRSVFSTYVEAFVVIGGSGNDTISTFAGNDSLSGGGGNDILDGGTGMDTMAGGAGNDIYYVDNAGDTVTENANEGTDEVRTTLAAYTLTGNVETLTGLASSGQALTGNGLDNRIVSSDGPDQISGGDGNDTIAFSSVQQSASGVPYSTYGSIDGGTGYDVLDLTNVGPVSLTGQLQTFALDAHTVTGNLHILGGSSGDTIVSGSGDDIIYGGLGQDTLTGGVGADIFEYHTLDDSTVAAADHITDFVSGTDKIDLHFLDADTTTAGDQAFAFIGGNAFGHHAGELRAEFDAVNNLWTVQGDVDGDGNADFTILVTTANGHQMANTDFVP